MMLVYDDTWLREPNLLVPGRKPIGPVVASSIAAGSHNFGRVDYLSKPGELLGGATRSPNGNLNIVGVWGEAPATADRYQLSSEKIRNILASGEYTYITRVRRILTASSCVLFSSGSPSAGTLLINCYLTTSSIYFVSHNGSWQSRSFSTTVGASTDWQTIAVVLTNDRAALYANGEYVSDIPFAKSSIPAASNQDFTVGTGELSSGNTNFYSEDAEYEYYQLYPNPLGLAEIRSLYIDPYQHLEAA